MTSKAKKTLAPRKELTEEKKITSKTKRVAGAQESARPGGGPLSLRSTAASAKADRPEQISKAKEFRSMKPARSQAAACRSCGWTGVIGDCAERGMGGDAFSEGWAWHCPNCKTVVEVYAWRQLELIAISS